jgi:hypothetical protein
MEERPRTDLEAAEQLKLDIKRLGRRVAHHEVETARNRALLEDAESKLHQLIQQPSTNGNSFDLLPNELVITILRYLPREFINRTVFGIDTRLRALATREAHTMLSMYRLLAYETCECRPVPGHPFEDMNLSEDERTVFVEGQSLAPVMTAMKVCDVLVQDYVTTREDKAVVIHDQSGSMVVVSTTEEEWNARQRKMTMKVLDTRPAPNHANSPILSIFAGPTADALSRVSPPLPVLTSFLF